MATKQLDVDSFVRANQSGWGTASGGSTWSTTLGTPTLSIASNEGHATNITAQANMQLGATTSQNAEGLVRVKTNNASASRMGISLRQTASNTFYHGRLSAAGNNIVIGKVVSGTNTDLFTAAFTVTTGSFYWIRFKVIGTNVMARCWLDGNSEPTTWNVSGTDSSITGAGGFGLTINSSSTTTTWDFDSFTVTDGNVYYDTTWRSNISKTTNKDSVWRSNISKTIAKDTSWRGTIGHVIKKDTLWRSNTSKTANKDTVYRGNISKTTAKDSVWRGNVGHTTTKDTRFRGVLSATTTKDTAYRGKIARFTTHDTVYRGNIAAFPGALFYASNVTQALGGLTQSDQMAQVAGGTETSVSVTMPATSTNTYVELLAQGGTASGTSVLPAPTGKGWSIGLAGNTIAYGSWSSIFTLAKSGTTMTGAGLYVRWFRRTMDGTYYPIGATSLTSQSFSTTKTVYSLPSVSATLWQFIAGDTLYMDAFVSNGATSWASAVFTVYVSNSSSLGVSNDAVIIAPQMITTPSGLSCLIGVSNLQSGSGIPVLHQSFTLADAIDQRSILMLIGEDTAGTLSYQRGMPVMFSDHDQGLLYTGAVNSDKATKPAAGGAAQLEHMLTFMDNHYLVDKRVNTTNYLNWSAGDMVCDFIQQTLGQEGITGAYALESDYTPATFGLGTLTGTVATTTTSPFVYAPNTASPPITSNTGDLELTRAGTQFTYTEKVTADFSSGTLTNMTASGNQLSPTTQSAVCMQATLGEPSSAATPASFATGASHNNIAGVFPDTATALIWSGSKTIGTNDTLNYDIWEESTSPAFQMGVDFICSDGTQLSTYLQTTCTSPYTIKYSLTDNAGYSVTYATDLSPVAKDAWFARSIDLTALHGKTLNSILLFVAGETAGIYRFYVKNCYLGSASGSPFFGISAIATQVNPPTIATTGNYLATLVSASVVAAYTPPASYRVSPAQSISGVGLVQNSTINWSASLPTTGPKRPLSTTSQPSPGAMLLFVSYDGATWLLCTNNAALPGLPAGANVAGLSLYLREQFSAGADPTALPALLQVTITINSAANQSTTDVTATYGTSAEWNTGTQVCTSPNSSGQLTTQTLARTWADANFLGQTWFPSAGGLDPGQQPTQTIASGSYQINIPYFDFNNNDNDSVISEFSFLGQGRDFTLEYDLTGSGGGNGRGNGGICYRTANWTKAPNQRGYYRSIGYFLSANWITNTLTLYCGSNTSVEAGGDTPVIASASFTFTPGTTYHFKLVVSGSSHTVYINHNASATLTVTDSKIMTGGGIGMIAEGWVPSGGTVTAAQATMDNLVFTPVGTWDMLNSAGYWTSPSTSLTSLGTCGNTQIAWSEINGAGASQTTAIVQTSIDGGSTYQVCTNGQTIPGLTSGTSVTGKSLLIQVLIFGSTSVTLPSIYGLYVRVCGNYGTVSGTRISPALSLTPVGYVAASNVMWNANIPTSTTLTVQTTQDLSTYHTVGSNGAGEALTYWTNQPAATQDLFSSNTLANYTNTNKSGGSTATATYDTTNSRVTLSGGSGGLYLNNSITCTDIDLLVDMDESDAGGLAWREVSTSNYYELGVYDASSSGGFTNQLRLYKVASGTRSLLGSASSVTFTRGTFHRIRVTMQGGLIDVYWDGACVQSYLDTSPLASGGCGLRNDGGTSRYYQLWVQPLGTNLSGQALSSKVTMTTTDPSVMPQLFVLVMCVRGASIATGATISQLHPATSPFSVYYSKEMDVAVQLSGDYYWYVNKWKQLIFGPRLARPGAFPLQSAPDPANASGYLLYQPQVSVLSSADLFRSQQIVTGAKSLVNPPPEIKAADGSTTSWTMGYPLYSAPTVLTGGQPATVGVQGIDSGRQFYWQPGSASISYDSTLPKLPAGTILSFTYVGQSAANVILNNSSSQAAQAALELNSGIVAEIESALSSTASGMSVAQATTFGNGLLARYGSNNTIELLGTTLYGGITPGTTIPIFLPEIMRTWNAQLPIVKVTTTALQGQNGLIWLYSIDATNGPSLNNWQRVFFSQS